MHNKVGREVGSDVQTRRNLILTPDIMLSSNCFDLAHRGPYYDALADTPTQDERRIEDDKH